MLLSVTPRAHRDPAVVEDKISRRTGNPTPWFDPDGGGIHARVLFLLEAPGTRASVQKGSGFISADNNDGTAENFFRIRDEVGLPRDKLVAWNVVPWYLPNGTRAGNATSQDIQEARSWLEKLMGLLGPGLRLVVPMGDPALKGWMRLLATDPSIPLRPTLALPHPSPRSLASRPEYRDRIRSGLQRVAEIVNAANWPPT